MEENKLEWWESFPNFGKRGDCGKIIFPAAERNYEPILEVFLREIPKYFSNNDLYLLEIASGAGQHASYIAPKFPKMSYQPSEYSTDLLPSISSYAAECISKNIKEPLHINIADDLKQHGFGDDSIDVIYCCNLIHVSPIDCAIGLFRNAGRYLRTNGIMITYGAYNIEGDEMAEGNLNFERKLKGHDERWGIRNLTDVKELASKNGIVLKEIFNLPANNKCIIWRKEN